jgi:hypothetical protein
MHRLVYFSAYTCLSTARVSRRYHLHSPAHACRLVCSAELRHLLSYRNETGNGLSSLKIVALPALFIHLAYTQLPVKYTERMFAIS